MQTLTHCELDDGQLGDDTGRADHVAEVLKALAHPIRLRIVAVLCRGDENVSSLARRLACKQAIISQQLRILRMRDLVQATRDQGYAYYALKEMRLTDLVHCVEGCSVPR